MIEFVLHVSITLGCDCSIVLACVAEGLCDHEKQFYYDCYCMLLYEKRTEVGSLV